MGKKKPEVMAKQKVKFLKGAAAKGYPAAVAEKIFELLVPFAGYGFNKSHAAAYSLIAYQTAYLKANHPAEFMAANLTNEIASTDKLAEYIGEARAMGLEVLPPDINLSDRNFTVQDGRIVYGLLGIKNVGTAAVDQILAERAKGVPFTGLLDFLERLDLKVVNRKVVETLIACGVFDRLGENRATLARNLDRLLEAVASSREARRYGQTVLFDSLGEVAPRLVLEQVPEWPQLELLNHERLDLGFYFSGHPLDKYRRQIQDYADLDLGALGEASTERSFTVIGLLKEVKEIVTRNGKRMAFAALEDQRGSVELVVFADVFEKSRALLAVDRVVAAVGRLDRSRGDPKLKVERLLAPEDLAPRPPRAVHVRFAGRAVDEQEFLRLRDLMVGKPGDCTVYFHIRGDEASGEIVIKASPQLALAAAEDVLSLVRSSPLVEDVWKE
jgi:DNA polymerase-3 subunit alpha